MAQTTTGNMAVKRGNRLFANSCPPEPVAFSRRPPVFSLLILLWLLYSSPAFAGQSVNSFLFGEVRPQLERILEEGFAVLPRNRPAALKKRICEGLSVGIHFGDGTWLRGVGKGVCIEDCFVKALVDIVDHHGRELSRIRKDPNRISLHFFRTDSPSFPPTKEAIISSIDPSIHGLALTLENSREVILLPVDFLTRKLLVNSRLSVEKILGRFSPVRCRKLRVRSFVEASTQHAILPFIYGTTPSPPINEQSLASALDAAGDYLTRHQRDGLFRYHFCPAHGHVYSTYNIVRHAGVLWAILRLYKETGDSGYLKSARSGLRVLADSVEFDKTARSDGLLAFVNMDGRSVLGATALSLLAFLELPPRLMTKKIQKLVRCLGRGLVSMQHPSGAFYLTRADARRRQLHKTRIFYYPGECLLALTRLDREAPSALWRRAALRAARHQLSQFRTKDIRCHWTAQGLALLGRDRADRELLRGALDMVRAMIKGQFRDYSRGPPGAWPSSITSTACGAACRLEALGPCIDAARALNEDARDLETAIILGARFILSQQYGPDNSFILAKGKDARGGIRSSLLDLSIRMDVNQHSISALLNALRLIRRRPYLAEHGNMLIFSHG